jgi:poly(3-hydroxybutyrate) depolymerase
MAIPKGFAFFLPLFTLFNRAETAAIRRRASADCGKTHYPGESREYSFESNRTTRTYRIHLPSSYGPNVPRPPLIAYHGAGGNPADFEAETNLSDESINPNMITVYPAGVDVNFGANKISQVSLLTATRAIGKARLTRELV